MTVFTCVPEWEAMLTCICVAMESKLGHQNIRLELEPIRQYSLFEEYIHVDGEETKARKMMDAICEKISPVVYRELAYSSLAYEPDILDNIYHVILLGFHLGKEVLAMVQYRDVFRNKEIRHRLGWEECHFREFLRFQEVGKEVYVAHIEPKSRIISILGEQFADRMPSEYWMIVDDTHKEAVIHPKDEAYYLRKLRDEEFDRLQETLRYHDDVTELWKVFFKAVAVEQRTNEKCQRNLFPLWTRKHAVEFL